MRLSRREMLRISALTSVGVTGWGLMGSCDTGDDGSGNDGGLFAGGGNNSAEGSAGVVLASGARLPEPFTVPLPIPPVLKPVRTTADSDYYEIVQRVARQEILPGLMIEVWGYDGRFPGPTIVSRRGRRTVVRHRNELPVPTVVHLHGGRTPAEHDGYPTDLVLPVGGWRQAAHHAGGNVSQDSKEYVYPLDQPAATLWYHDHRMDFTGPQVYKGLAGFHLVHDDVEDALPLPRGERDVPLMIADRAFTADGAFDYPSLDPTLRGEHGVEARFMSGVLADCVLVNGAPWPVLEVTNTRYRFRILNASNARRYRLALDPPPPSGPAFTQIGSDLGLLAAPVEHGRIDLAQAERFDVLVDFGQYAVGAEVTLVNEYGAGGSARVMRFVVARRGREDSAVPDRMAEIRPLSKADAVVQRNFNFHRGGSDKWSVNDQPFSMDAIAAPPELGTVELWKLRALNVEHPFHLHLAPFQVVSRDGNDGQGDFDAGWKDTVNLDNGGNAEVLVKFDGYKGRYVFHCHNLEHEDMGMMANFEVT